MTHSEIRSRAGIPSIESLLLHRQLRCLKHVIRMPHSRLPHCVLYGQLRLGHRSVGGQKKRFKFHIKSLHKKCNIPFSRLETLASNRATWRSTCAFGMSYLDGEYDRAAALRCSRRHQHAPVICPIPDFVHQCPLCVRQCFSPTFNVEEEVVVIHNGWTPKKMRNVKSANHCVNKDLIHGQNLTNTDNKQLSVYIFNAHFNPISDKPFN